MQGSQVLFLPPGINYCDALTERIISFNPLFSLSATATTITRADIDKADINISSSSALSISALVIVVAVADNEVRGLKLVTRGRNYWSIYQESYRGTQKEHHHGLIGLTSIFGWTHYTINLLTHSYLLIHILLHMFTHSITHSLTQTYLLIYLLINLLTYQ